MITSANVDSSSLILSLNGVPSLSDKSQVVLRFSPNISVPAGASSCPVYIRVNDVEYELLNRFGDSMTCEDLLTTKSGSYFYPRFNYLSYVGATPNEHFITHNFPLKTCSYYVY